MKFQNIKKPIVSEWEENVLFDADDPDFCNSNSHLNVLQPVNSITLKLPSTMSLASVHGPQFGDHYAPIGRNNISVSSSLSDLVGSPFEISVDNVLTIEELRAQMGSCFTCGVSWTDDHVSLDCSECGGYSSERPCPLCDGKCGIQWKRDFTMSHACSKARWLGVCPSYPEAALNLTAATNNGTIVNHNNIIPVNTNNSNTNVTTVAPPSCAAANQLLLAQELCARLEQLSASAQT